MEWTEEKNQWLREMVAKGHSYGVIAEQLGVTRSTIGGKVSRLGLVSTRRPGLSRDEENRIRRERRRQIRKAKARIARTPHEAKQREYAPGPPGGVLLLDLKSDSCRFPIHDDDQPARFCGAKTFRRLAYCEHHCRIAYQR